MKPSCVLAFALLVGCVDSKTSADGESSSNADSTTGAPARCDGAPDDGDVEVRAATLTVADFSGMSTNGSYTYVVYDGGGLSLYGEFFTAALSCPLLDPCG